MGDFIRGEMVVKVEDWFVFGITVIETDRLVVGQKKIVVNKRHGNLLDLDFDLLDFSVEGKRIFVVAYRSSFVSSDLQPVNGH